MYITYIYIPKLEDHGLIPGPFVISNENVFFFTFAAIRPIL